MLALKKKREAEAKAKAEADASAASEGAAGGAVQSPGSAPTTSSTTASSNKVSLLGIGGKKTKADGSAANGQKKRSPGEIRIQKGEYDDEFVVAYYIVLMLDIAETNLCRASVGV